MTYRRVIFGLTIIYILFYGFNLTSIPPVLFDEPFYAMTAHSYAREGHFMNQLSPFAGRQFFFYPFLLGLFFKMGDTTLFIGRLFSFVLGLWSLHLFLGILKRIQAPLGLFTLGGIGFLVANTGLVSFRIIRPESVVITLALLLIFLLFTGNRDHKKTYIGFGLLSGCLTLTHLIGFLIALGPMLVVMWEEISKKKWGHVGLIVLSGTPLLLWFLINLVSQYGSLSDALAVLGQTGKVSTDRGVFGLLMLNVSDSLLSGYMMGVKRAGIVVVELVSLGLAFRLKHPLAKYLGAMNVSLLLGGLSCIDVFLRPYFSVLPYVTLLLLTLWVLESTITRKAVSVVILVLYCLNHLAGAGYFVYKHRSNEVGQLFEMPITFHHPSFPILSYLEFWFLSPDSHWIKTERPTHEELVSTYGGYYVILSPFKTGNHSSTSLHKDHFDHSSFNSKYDYLRQQASYGHKQFETHIHPWGMVEVWEIMK